MHKHGPGGRGRSLNLAIILFSYPMVLVAAAGRFFASMMLFPMTILAAVGRFLAAPTALVALVGRSFAEMLVPQPRMAMAGDVPMEALRGERGVRDKALGGVLGFFERRLGSDEEPRGNHGRLGEKSVRAG